MALSLSSADLHHITRATSTLLSPLDHASIDDWRRAVNRAVCALVGADAAVFMLPGAGGPMVYSEEITQEQLASYPDLQPPLTARGESILARVVADRVVTIASAYRQPGHGFYRSAYYHEHFGRGGMHSLVCAGHALEGQATLGGVATVQPMRVKRARRPLGERERRLMALVHPALVAGLTAWRQFGAVRDALLTTLDGLGQAVLVCDSAGRRLHQTEALDALLATEPEQATIRAAMHQVVLLCRTSDAVPGEAGAAFVREVRTATARYRIRSCHYHGTESHGGASGLPLLLVALDRRTPVLLSDAELRSEYGLTAAQLRVARLVADGKRNDEIASLLGISSFTVRRHTEQVLQKLGAASRAAVAARLHS